MMPQRAARFLILREGQSQNAVGDVLEVGLQTMVGRGTVEAASSSEAADRQVGRGSTSNVEGPLSCRASRRDAWGEREHTEAAGRR